MSPKPELSMDRKAKLFQPLHAWSQHSASAGPLTRGEQRRLLEAEVAEAELRQMLAAFEEEYGEDVEWVD